LCENVKPPGTPPFGPPLGFDFGAEQKIALADNADQCAGCIHDRDSTDAVLPQERSQFLHGRIR
jgi:hypothetical protein